MPKFNSDRQCLRHVNKKLARIVLLSSPDLAQRAAQELHEEIEEHFLSKKLKKSTL